MEIVSTKNAPGAIGPYSQAIILNRVQCCTAMSGFSVCYSRGFPALKQGTFTARYVPVYCLSAEGSSRTPCDLFTGYTAFLIPKDPGSGFSSRLNVWIKWS